MGNWECGWRGSLALRFFRAVTGSQKEVQDEIGK